VTPQKSIGELQAQRGLATRERLYFWFAENPCSAQQEACDALGLSRATVGKHVAAIRDGWRPVAEE